MKKIFISYATKDYNKLKAFRNEIKRRGKFKAIVAANKQNPGTTLADKKKYQRSRLLCANNDEIFN